MTPPRLRMSEMIPQKDSSRIFYSRWYSETSPSDIRPTQSKKQGQQGTGQIWTPAEHVATSVWYDKVNTTFYVHLYLQIHKLKEMQEHNEYMWPCCVRTSNGPRFTDIDRSSAEQKQTNWIVWCSISWMNRNGDCNCFYTERVTTMNE